MTTFRKTTLFVLVVLSFVIQACKPIENGIDTAFGNNPTVSDGCDHSGFIPVCP